jgi:hypothetical protein
MAKFRDQSYLITATFFTLWLQAGVLWAEQGRTRDLTFSVPAASSADQRSSRLASDRFAVDIGLAKPRVRVNQDFGLFVQGNEPFFLYVFFVDKNTKTPRLVMPVAGQGPLRFAPGQQYTIPQSGAFYADEPGREALIVVAAQQAIDWHRYDFQPMQVKRKAVVVERIDLQVEPAGDIALTDSWRVRGGVDRAQAWPGAAGGGR